MSAKFSTSPSTEELTWLQASLLFENSLSHPVEEDINLQSDTMSLSSESCALPSKAEYFSSQSRPVFPATPRSEWIYRTPKSPSGLVAQSSPGNSRHFKGHYTPSLFRSRSNASSRTAHTPVEDCDSVNSFSSKSFSPVHSRTRPNVSILPLRPIPSESQLIFTPSELAPCPKMAPRLSHITTPTLSPAFDSTFLSHSPTSSRSDSPVTPVSLSSTCRTGRRHSYDLPRHRHRRCSHSTEIPRTSTVQSSPSKSILTRTASVSTKASSHTVNKSVKFATIPTVHYATRAYWDMDIADADSIEINIDSMDLDDDPFANYRSREGSLIDADEKSFVTQPHDTQPTTTSSGQFKQSPKRMKRLIRLARNSVQSTHANDPKSERPIISSPYALGSYSANSYHVVGAESSTSLINRPWLTSSLPFGKNNEAEGSSCSVVLPLKNGFSLESLRRSRPSRAVSLRSVESTSSRAKRFRTWLSRMVG